MKPALQNYCLAMLLAIMGVTYGQIGYSENFSTGATGWSGSGFETTTLADCSGNGAIRARVNADISKNRIITAMSAPLGVSDGSEVALRYSIRLLAFDAVVPQYALPNVDFGRITVEAATAAGGAWAVIDRIDISNYSATSDCVQRTARLEVPLGQQLFIKFSAVPGTDINTDYYVYIDEIIAWQGALEDNAGDTLASAYINPGDNYLHLEFNAPIDEWAIFNMQGQQVTVRDIDGNGSRLDISGLAYGNYMIKLRSADRIETVNIMKQ